MNLRAICGLTMFLTLTFASFGQANSVGPDLNRRVVLYDHPLCRDLLFQALNLKAKPKSELYDMDFVGVNVVNGKACSAHFRIQESADGQSGQITLSEISDPLFFPFGDFPINIKSATRCLVRQNWLMGDFMYRRMVGEQNYFEDKNFFAIQPRADHRIGFIYKQNRAEMHCLGQMK